MEKIKVLIVEDSKIMQEMLVKILGSDPAIEVVGVAADPLIAREIIKKTNPDVLTLDIMLPHMDGITFLKNLMRLRPMPVVMISTLTEKGNALALEALALGAIDYLPKPNTSQVNDLAHYTEEVLKTIKGAAGANVKKGILQEKDESEPLKSVQKSEKLKEQVIVMGASTGGIEALETILFQLPMVMPPIIIVQHIKQYFNKALIIRLQKVFGNHVVLPEDNMEITPGNIYVANADQHLTIQRTRKRYIAKLEDSAPVHSHKPSIDVLFHSVAQACGPKAIGVLLTGMGKDGAEGLKAIRVAGGATIAQDEQSSVVWGMPGHAVKLHAAERVVGLKQIPHTILAILDQNAMKQN